MDANLTIMGTWDYDKAQEDSVEVDAAAAHCDPGALSADTVAAALDGEHMLMVGDSLSRYTWLSLAYFMETGRWRSPWPPNTRELSWKAPLFPDGDWAAYFSQTTSRIGGGDRAMCDCYRSREWEPSEWRENRFYLSRNGRVRLSYSSYFPGYRTGVHNVTRLGEGCLESAFRGALHSGGSAAAGCPQLSCSPGQCSEALGDGDLSSTYPSLLPSIVAALRPSVLVLNAGLWPLQPVASEVAAAIRAAVSAVAPSRLRVLWRTTTAINGKSPPHRGGLEEDESDSFVKALMKEAGDLVQVWDVQALTVKAAETGLGFGWDTLHFVEGAYSLFNAALLGCMSGQDCV